MAQNIKRKEKINFRSNLRMYHEFLKKYNPIFFVLLLIIFLGEASYLVDKFLFKIIVDRGTEFASNAIASDEYARILSIVAVIFLALLAFKALNKWFQLHFVNILESRMILDLKKKFFSHIIGLSYGFHTMHKTGSLISRLVRGGGAVERMSDVIFFNFAPMLFQLIFVGASLLYFDRLSAIITFIVVLCFLLYNLLINELQQESNAVANDAEDIEKANIGDIFTNIESIKYFGKEAAIKNRYARLNELTREAVLRNWNYFRWLDFGQTFILGIGTFMLVYFSVLKFMNGIISLGILVFIYTTYVSVFGNLFGFVYGIRNFYKAMVDFEPLFQYAKVQNEVKDVANAKEMNVRNGAIEFRNLSFSYGKRRIFQNFSLKIPKGKKVAFVGHSGCGKSTLVKLLFRLYDIERGNILIDYKDIKKYKQESLRSELSIVPQECMLFDDTIYNNIAFSRPDARKGEVFMAMKFAQLDKIISKFPNGEKTIVGERGIKLSGGEKQRVSIARALLADKKILVLDEATSSLDSKTEFEIQKALEKLMEGKTVIIIAHRISTIINSDIIVVMDKGRIAQAGKHETLVGQDGLYKRLWDLQKGGYIR